MYVCNAIMTHSPMEIYDINSSMNTIIKIYLLMIEIYGQSHSLLTDPRRVKISLFKNFFFFILIRYMLDYIEFTQSSIFRSKSYYFSKITFCWQCSTSKKRFQIYYQISDVRIVYLYIHQLPKSQEKKL